MTRRADEGLNRKLSADRYIYNIIIQYDIIIIYYVKVLIKHILY